MSKRYRSEVTSTESNSNSGHVNYSQIIFNRNNDKKYNDDWLKINDSYQRKFNNIYAKNTFLDTKNSLDYKEPGIYTTYTIPKGNRKKNEEEKFRSPNICIAKDQMVGSINCNCNRHFQLNVPDLRKNEVTTTL